MKTLKEIKAAMTADEMNQIKGGVDSIQEGKIDTTLIQGIGTGWIKSVSAECSKAGYNCGTVRGLCSWLVADLD